jgi:hypothetical protein
VFPPPGIAELRKRFLQCPRPLDDGTPPLGFARVGAGATSLTLGFMNKFTLFTLFLSAIIVVIVGEMMVNEYIQTPYNPDGQADVFQAHPASVASSQQQPAPAASTQQNIAASAGSITAGLLQKSGLDSYSFKAVPYGGNLLDRIPFPDLKNFIATYESHLYKNQTALVASFYEFDAGSDDSTKEIYVMLKQKCSAEIGVIINETNTVGSGSFYVNYFQYPEKVFVVFSKGTRVFAFSYDKELHPAVGRLIGLL